MIGRTNADGGGAVNTPYSIAVKYPKGSVCTCAKDGKTYKAKDKIGCFLFGLGSAGTWAVTIAKDGASRAFDFTVSDDEAAVVAELGYAQFICKAGRLADGITTYATPGSIEQEVSYGGRPCLNLHTGNAVGDFTLSGFTVPTYARNIHLACAIIHTAFGSATISIGGHTVIVSGDEGVDKTIVIPVDSVAGRPAQLSFHIIGGAYRGDHYITDIWLD